MADRGLVGFELRRGGHFVEIAHEMFVSPAIAAIQRAMSDSEFGAFRNARSVLRRCLESDFRIDVRFLLKSAELGILHGIRDRIQWSPPAVELMLRSAAVRCSDGDGNLILRYWTEAARATGLSAEAIVSAYSDADDPQVHLAAKRALAMMGVEESSELAPSARAITFDRLVDRVQLTAKHLLATWRGTRRPP